MTDSLNERFGAPLERVALKVKSHLDPWLQAFIGLSPFVVLATVDAEGGCTASPRGGRPGFVRVLDESTLLIPDYAGNRLFESARNITSSGQVGLLFLIPGFEESARISGSCDVLDVDAVRDQCADTAAERYFRVRVQRAYYHCGRGVRAANLWDIAAIAQWRESPQLPKRPPAAAQLEVTP